MDCMFMYVTLHVASVPSSLGLTADSHPASENYYFFSEYNRPSMISLSNVCICIPRERALKKKKKGGKK